jgi:zinc protease
LNAYNVFRDDPGYFDLDLERYRAVSSASVSSAVGRWLVDRPRVALSVVPRGRRDLALADAVEVAVS